LTIKRSIYQNRRNYRNWRSRKEKETSRRSRRGRQTRPRTLHGQLKAPWRESLRGAARCSAENPRTGS